MENTPEEETVSPHSLIIKEHVEKSLLADKGKDAKLISWNIVDFTKKGDNYASTVTSVELKYCVNNQEEQDVTYIVKVNPCRQFMGFDGINSIIFMKEAKFYLSLIPELNSALTEVGQEPLWFPGCFHSSLEANKEQIYFEDVRAKGFKMFDKMKGMDKEHASLVLRELARLHAASYLLQSKTHDEALEVKHDFLLKDWLSFTESTKEKMVPVMQGHLGIAVEMLKKVEGNERVVSWIESLKPKLEDIFTSGMQSENFGSICHGDCWNNNVLFRYNDEGKPIDVMLVDLQICRKASLATDLNYFMYLSLTGDVRTANLTNFLSIYHSSYKEVMDAGGLNMRFTEDELLKEFREKNVIGAIFGIMTLPFLIMKSSEVPEVSEKGKEKDSQEKLEDHRRTVIGMLDTNPLMKPRFLAIFDELMETGLIP